MSQVYNSQRNIHAVNTYDAREAALQMALASLRHIDEQRNAITPKTKVTIEWFADYACDIHVKIEALLREKS